jgi:hypothetical protein
MSAKQIKPLDASMTSPSPGYTVDDLEFYWELLDQKDWCVGAFWDTVTPSFFKSSYTMAATEVGPTACEESRNYRSSDSNPNFYPIASGNYEVKLTVKNGNVTSKTFANIPVAGDPNPPIAIAGPDRNRIVGETVTLDGSQSVNYINDGAGSMYYYWTLDEAPEGSAAVLDSNGPLDPIVTFKADKEGVYWASLVVHDATQVSSLQDKVKITVGDAYPTKPPMANAGSIQYVPAGSSSITLHGENSTAGSACTLVYKWTPVEYPFSFPELSNDTSANPSFTPAHEGKYVFRLKASCGEHDSYDDAIVIYGSEASTACPIAIVETPIYIKDDRWHTFDGSKSVSPDGAPLKYRWEIISHPYMSKKKYVLSNSTSVKPSFHTEIPGTYAYRLIVDNGNPSIGSCPKNEAVLKAYVRD